MEPEGTGFAVGERVFVHGLVSGRGATFNLRPARVVLARCQGGLRVGVELLQGVSSAPAAKGRAKGTKRVQLSVKPSNLLRASRPLDRRRVLLAQAVASRPELRCVRRFLDCRLPAGPGDRGEGGGVAALTDDSSPLLFRVASFVAGARALPHQFSGYMGRLWFEHWRFDGQGRAVKLEQQVQGKGGEEGGRLTPRMDCAAVALGPECPSLALFAGGCCDHPQRCPRPFGFFKSAVLYDSLLQEWLPLPDMTTRRHGPGGACVGRKAYVLGGQYAHDSDDEDGGEASRAGGRHVGPRFCDVFDFDTQQWSLQPPSSLQGVLQEEQMLQVLDRAAFFSVGATCRRVVACLHDRRLGREGLTTLAFNPQREEDGWRKVVLPDGNAEHVQVGTSSCAAEYNDELVVVSGRPSGFARRCAAFRFLAGEPSLDEWHHGRWRQLPDLNCARVGGALVVVEGKLYVTGGVDEETGEFRADAERLDDAAEPPCWKPVPWLHLPRALHGHACLALPTLEWNERPMAA